MREIKILSDYTSTDDPNYVKIIIDNQSDIHISVVENDDLERGVRLATSGSRYRGEPSVRLRKALKELVDACEEVLSDDRCHPDILKLNSRG